MGSDYETLVQMSRLPVFEPSTQRRIAEIAAHLRNTDGLADAVEAAIKDSESGDGWGPDVTVVDSLQKALATYRQRGQEGAG